jgi:hypothetical protein
MVNEELWQALRLQAVFLVARSQKLMLGHSARTALTPTGKGAKDNRNVGVMRSQDTPRVAVFIKQREKMEMEVGDKRQILER